MSNVDIMRKYADILKEDEYGRDQGAMNEPENAKSEEEFMEWVKYDDMSEHRYEGEGDGNYVNIRGNEVYVNGDRRMGKLSSAGGDIVVMHGDYTEEGNDSDLIGALKKGPEGIDVWFYATGYEGTNKTMAQALDTLIIAGWG